MAVFKRYRGKRITQSDPNWHKARWWMEFRLRGHYILESVVGARTKAQAERAENTIREEIYNGRYNKKIATAKFTDFVDQHPPFFVEKHGHGYLTYVLVEEGLKTPSADVDPRDGQVMVREWLDYGTQRVPQLLAEDARLRKSASRPSTQAQTAQQKPPRTTRPRRGRQGTGGTEQRESEKARQLERDKVHVPGPMIPGEKFLQQPRVFYRREVEPTPLVVARPN